MTRSFHPYHNMQNIILSNPEEASLSYLHVQYILTLAHTAGGGGGGGDWVGGVINPLELQQQ